ncbi:hypothetical protein GDO86_001172 [Hymenochirus boettgeri]|uniref:U6 snRNA-associated Sm-like protein LSm4 n=1 Tax=Hymenochirus boettgeri TaxID=247094 RepID=A0A8T2KCK5_9PIPI|nr:hypothetical protein GDO86_001172 [Hymenochirus boettgeri]
MCKWQLADLPCTWSDQDTVGGGTDVRFTLLFHPPAAFSVLRKPVCVIEHEGETSVGASPSGVNKLVELKNGETYNGHLVSCDNWMNINLREVICTSRDGDKFWRMPECYIQVMSKDGGRGGMQQQKQMKGRGAGGAGRGVFGGRGRGIPGAGRGQQDKKPGRQAGKQ